MNKNVLRGITVLEVVIGVSIAALVLTFSVHAITQFINASRSISEKTAALYLAEEGLEMVRFVRDSSWATVSALSVNTVYGIRINGSNISIVAGPESIDGFTRSFTVQNVYRNAATQDIVASTTGGSVADTGSKYVFMTVAGGIDPATTTLTTILTNLDP